MTSSTQAQAMIDYENEIKRRDRIRAERELAYVQLGELEYKIVWLKEKVRALGAAEDELEPRLRELARIATYGE